MRGLSSFGTPYTGCAKELQQYNLHYSHFHFISSRNFKIHAHSFRLVNENDAFDIHYLEIISLIANDSTNTQSIVKNYASEKS